MPKLTLLDMVQSTLSAMDSDSVNSIDDTIEAEQVALIAKESYFELLSQRDWPFLRTLFSLEGLGDTNNPTTMNIPETINKVFWVRVNKKEVQWLEPDVFKDMLDTRLVDGVTVDSSGFILNRDPLYYTSYDDAQFVFDAYDKDATSTITTGMTECYGVISPTWTHEDTFIPTLPDKMFPMLLAEIKSVSFVSLKQQANALEARRSQRGRVTFQNEAWKNNLAEATYNRKVDYGRK